MTSTVLNPMKRMQLMGRVPQSTGELDLRIPAEHIANQDPSVRRRYINREFNTSIDTIHVSVQRHNGVHQPSGTEEAARQEASRAQAAQERAAAQAARRATARHRLQQALKQESAQVEEKSPDQNESQRIRDNLRQFLSTLSHRQAGERARQQNLRSRDESAAFGLDGMNGLWPLSALGGERVSGATMSHRPSLTVVDNDAVLVDEDDAPVRRGLFQDDQPEPTEVEEEDEEDEAAAAARRAQALRDRTATLLASAASHGTPTSQLFALVPPSALFGISRSPLPMALVEQHGEMCEAMRSAYSHLARMQLSAAEEFALAAAEASVASSSSSLRFSASVDHGSSMMAQRGPGAVVAAAAASLAASTSSSMGGEKRVPWRSSVLSTSMNQSTSVVSPGRRASSLRPTTAATSGPGALRALRRRLVAADASFESRTLPRLCPCPHTVHPLDPLYPTACAENCPLSRDAVEHERMARILVGSLLPN